MPPRLSALASAASFEMSWILPPEHTGAEIEWISSSDLPDPAPFLQCGQILLTTGTQFVSAAAPAATDYIQRLLDRGVIALGFGTEVVREGTPAELIATCAELGMPLFEVPYRTPFLALIRWAADEIAREQHVREQWLIDAQRAVSAAAMTAGGIDAAVRMLARRTGLTALRFDAEARILLSSAAVPAEDRERMQAEMRRLLARRGRAASVVPLSTGPGHLQSVGRSAGSRGGLALIGERAAEREVRFVIESTVALIEMSLRDEAVVSAAGLAFGAGYLELLLAGQTTIAAQLAKRSGLPVPADPLLAVISARAGAAVVAAALPSALLLPRAGGAIVLFSTSEAEALAAIAARTAGFTVGCSGAVEGEKYPRALQEAEAALALAARRGASFLSVADAAERSLGDLVDSDLARRRAAHLLADAPWLEDARVWLRHNAQFEPAARELGVHRHTLKTRMRALGDRTGLQLDDIAGRTELWILLTAKYAVG